MRSFKLLYAKYLSAFDETFLTWTGFGLALCHALTAQTWLFPIFYLTYTAESHESTCHAFYPSCLNTFFQPTTLVFTLYLYAALSLITAALFLSKKYLRWSLPLLAILTAFKIYFFLLRFNVMGNYHLIHFVMVFVFLFLPNKRFALTLSLACIYFMAGLLKWNLNWLSGSALTNPPAVNGFFLFLSLAHAVTLENFLVWGLLFRARWIRVMTLIQLTAFHLISWHIVNYFYPVLMILILLPHYIVLRERSATLPRLREIKWPVFVFLGTIFAFNLAPYMTGRDPALEGRYRSLRINMLDARPFCYPLAFLNREKETVALTLMPLSSLRTRCDSSVFDNQLRRYCSSIDNKESIRYVLYSRKAFDDSYKIIENDQDACTRLNDSNN